MTSEELYTIVRIRFCALAIAVLCCSLLMAADERLHDAVAKAENGATVRIAPGTYRIERPIVVPEGKTLSIVADGPDGTVVDAGGRTNCFVFLSRGANLLKGITVRNGRGAPCIPGDETWYAGGVVMRGGTVDGCRIEGCSTLSRTKAIGGGISTWGRVKDTVVSNCHVRVRREHNGGTHPLVCSGGGILLYGGRGASGCTVEECSAEALAPGPAVGGYGGGIEVFGDARVENSRVSGCRASMGGGGIHLNSGGHVSDCVVESNSVAVAWRWDGMNLGGGVSVGGASGKSRIERTRFIGNRIGVIDAVDAPCGGGGLGVGDADGVVVADCEFIGNEGFNGGAAYFRNSRANVTGCRCYGNTADRLGPNFAMSATDGVTVDGCTASSGELLARPRQFNHDTDWMAGSIGVFQHRLYGRAPAALKAMERIDPQAMARQLADIGADYFCITLHQCVPSFIAPNDVYEDICGHPRGSVCLQRDVPAELAAALKAKGIRLMLYSTGTPPREDVEGVKRIGYTPNGRGDPRYTPEGARNWAKVLEFWSRRYGETVSGWWIDGCYSSIGFDRSDVCAASLFASALKSGNPHAVVAFNPGFGFKPYTPYEDYICGEINEPFFEACVGRWVDGRQWHLLTYFYTPMGLSAPVRYTDGEWIEWLTPVLKRGGCVTVDPGSLDTGCIAPAPAAQFKRVVAAVRGRLPKDGADAAKIARENEIRLRTDAIDAANTSYEHGQRRFLKCQYAMKSAVPDRTRLRRTATGETIWTDAIQATLDARGGVFLPQTTTPYLLDGPIMLKAGQSLVMEQSVMFRSSLRSGTCTRFAVLPGTKGPLIATCGPGPLRDIYIRGVVFEGCDSPMSFCGVDGLVVREIAFRRCTGTGIRLADVCNFRVDALLALECGRLDQVVGIAGGCAKGMLRNIDGMGVKAVNGNADGAILEAVSGVPCR